MLTDRTCRNRKGRKGFLYIPISNSPDRYQACIVISNSASGRDPENPSRCERPWKHGSAQLVQPPDDIGSYVQQPYQPAIEAVEEGVFVQTTSVLSYHRTLEQGRHRAYAMSWFPRPPTHSRRHKHHPTSHIPQTRSMQHASQSHLP
jgi:hypothetical protein